MNILIKGLEMPINEPLLVKINPDGSVNTTAQNDYQKYEAIPIPPHGGLIDVNTLKEQLKKPIVMPVDKAERLWEGWHECTIGVNAAIEATPIVIEAEENE